MKNKVIQFNEKHKWCGAFGVIVEEKDCGDDKRLMIAIPMLENNGVGGNAYIFSMLNNKEFDIIGSAALVPGGEE